VKTWICLIAATVGLSVRSETLTLNPVADTAIMELFPDNNMGGFTDMPVGGLHTTSAAGTANRAHGLIRFGFENIPAGAKVTQVTLQIRVSKVPNAAVSSPFTLHRLLHAWGEGNKDAQTGDTATDGEATWITSGQGDWAAPGGEPGTDYVSAGSATMTLAGTGIYKFPQAAALTADVQAWLDGTSQNFGWILISENEAAPLSAKRIGTHENLQVLNRPVLTVEYTVPVADLRITGISISNGTVHLTWTGGSPFYRVQRKSSLSLAQWEDASGFTQTTSADIGVSGDTAFYRVVGGLVPPP
jgi:hypothetical protein